MKTKYLFTALAMPALFAACTSEEFMAPQNGALNSDVLASREKGELILDATRADALADAATRIVGEETANGGISWLWEGKDDKIGASVVDYTGDIFPDASANYVITNYPFAPNIEGPSKSANFSTPTAVVTGAYIFYNKYDGNNTDRRKLQSSLAGTIQAKAGIEEGLKQVGTVEKGGQNFFISPIIDLKVKDGEAIQKPVELTSIYSVLQIRLKTELEDQYYNKGFRVNKIVLKSANGDNIFKRDITISPKKIQEVQKAVNNSLPAGKKDRYFKSNGAINAMWLTDAEVNEALDLVNAAFQNPNNKIGDESGDDNELVYQLDKEFVFNADNKDAQLDVLVVLPSNKYVKKAGSELYETKQEGVFLMTVYTSEGIYNSYIMNSVSDYTFERGKMYQLPVKTMKIGAGTTNVELFDQAEAFDVETTQDWNYAVSYINEHYRDYGNQNNWVAPVLKLSGNVEVDAEHYFPNFPVKYSGNYTINLKGQSEYKIDPTKAIFDKTNLPTINITGQKGATIVFDQDIKAGVKATNGDEGTETIKLVTDAKVIVNDGKEVNFSSLETKNEMNVGKASMVKVNGGVFVANGKFNVGENATVTAEVKLENKAEMTIAKGAKVTVPTQSYNENKIDVTGTFDAKGSFENKAGKTIIVKSHEQEDLNMDSRGTAKFEILNNKGIINITERVKLKGTYGGLVEVATLNNGVDKNTKAEINVNGELKAATVNNEEKAVIKLLGDPYALIQVNSAENKGTVELTAPAKYEMFDTYYSKSQNIAPLKVGNGFIVATLTNDLFNTVKANHEKYNSDQETALEVLEKIYLNGEVTLVNVHRLNDMDVMLNNGSTLKIGENNVAINNITTDGSATINSKDNNERQLTVNGTISVPENKSLTIGSKAKVYVEKPGTGFGEGKFASINITGTLTNNGMIDCPDGSSLATYIYTMINNKGTFNNNGRLCKEGTNVYTSSTENFTLVQDFINALQAGNSEFEVNGKTYVVYSNIISWSKAAVAFTKDEINTFFTSTPATWNNGTYSGYTIKKGSKDYYIWTSSPQNNKADLNIVLAEAKEAATAPAANNMFTEILNVSFTQKGTQFNIMNNGTLYLKKTDIAKNVWAYGVSKNSDTATKTGKFTNEE